MHKLLRHSSLCLVAAWTRVVQVLCFKLPTSSAVGQQNEYVEMEALLHYTRIDHGYQSPVTGLSARALYREFR